MNEQHYKQVKSFGNTRTIHFKYFGPSNLRGSRIKLQDKWFGESKTIAFDYTFSSSYEIAISWLLNQGWSVIGMNTEDGIILVEGWNKRLSD